MDTYPTPSGHASQLGEPTWEIAYLFPSQGEWSEIEFKSLQTPHRFELSNGILETLPMASWLHQFIAVFLFDSLRAHLTSNPCGWVMIAPLFVRLAPKEIRQPDVVFVRHENIVKDLSKIQNGADLVMEVVSSGDESRERDWVTKRKVYAAAGIAEYWVVDPEEKLITIFTLDTNGEYRVAGEYREGNAASILLPGFSVDVSATFAAGEGKRK
jgi:Uma2 family endonuclease